MTAISSSSQDRESSRLRALSRGTAVAVLAALALLILIYGGYQHHWPWTGIDGRTATLWDWLHLLLLPIAVVILPLWLARREALGSWHKAAGMTILTVFLAVVLFGYLTPWTWTGFTGNTLWDWLGLLALPLAVALIPVIRNLHSTWRRRDWLLLTAALLLFLVPVLGGYLGNWSWTGFRGNTLWDWLHLLILPLLVPIVLIPALKPLAAPEPFSSEQLAPAPAESKTAAAPARPATGLLPTPASSEREEETATRAPDSHREDQAPGKDRIRAQTRWLATVTGLSALVIAGTVVLAIELSANHPANLKQDTGRLNAIVQQFIAGKRLSQTQNQYATAAQNRTMVLEQLGALPLPPQLRGAAATLRMMTADSLAYNLLMAQGQNTQATVPDAAHNALRAQFVTQFNPYARRYLRLTYQPGDL